MAYATTNFPTKKALKEAVAAFNAGTGPAVTVAPGMFGEPKEFGVEFLEGPHYPKPHMWYAQVTVKHFNVVKVK